MKLSEEDQQLLGELCSQNDVNLATVQKLLETVYDYEFKERRTGIYDALREILKKNKGHGKWKKSRNGYTF